MSKKIAVVGAGLSGLAAAWMLRNSGFEVTVFEATASAGGHAEMLEIELKGRKMQFDGYLGNLSISHNLLKVNELLGIQVTRVAFGLCSDYPDKHWTTYQPSPFLEQYRSECLRFQALLGDLYEHDSTVEATAVSLKDFLGNNGFSAVFAEYVVSPFLEPMLGMGFEDFDLLPTSTVVELLGGGISSFLQPTPVYLFGGGMHDFVQQFSAPLGDCIRYNCPVESIFRTATGVLLRSVDGTEAPFDEVVMACNFEISRRLIDNPTPVETSIFNSFSYKSAHLVVHTDTSVVPASFFEDHRLRCLVNQYGISAPVLPHDSPGQRERQVLITSTARTNGRQAVDPDKILCERTYREEILNTNTILAKSLVHHIQGHQHCWYCGLSTTSALAESTFVSGLVVAAQLGANYPFADHPEAALVFDNIRRLMLDGLPSLRMFA